MFVDELKAKFKIEDLCAYSLTVFDNKNVVVEGVKNIIFADENQVKIRVKKTSILLLGEGLKILEVGEGNLLITGTVKGVEYD